jgi:hypothetical protein
MTREARASVSSNGGTQGRAHNSNWIGQLQSNWSPHALTTKPSAANGKNKRGSKQQLEQPNKLVEVISTSTPPIFFWPSCYPSSPLRRSSPIFMDSDRLMACSALKAAQAGLADSLTWLRVATAARVNRAPGEEGELFATAGMGLPAPVGGHSLHRQLSPFLPGGSGFLGGGTEGNSVGERTSLASDNSAGGLFQILQGYERRVDTPLTGDRGEPFVSCSEGSRGGGLLSQPPSFRLGAFTSLLREGTSNDDKENGAYGVNRGSIPTVGGAGGEEQAKRDGRRLAAHQESMGQLLYGLYGPDT